MAVKTDTITTIVKALQNNDLGSLTPAQLEYFEICNLADNLISQYGPGKITAGMLRTTISDRYGKDVHITTAYEYIARAQTIFNSRGGIDKKYWRGFIIEELMVLITELKKDLYGPDDSTLEKPIADQNGDVIPELTKEAKHRALDPKLVREYTSAIDLLKSTLQIDKEDPSIPLEDEFDTLIISSDPKDAGFEDYIILDSEIEDRLIELGATKDKDGNWN